MARPEQRHAGVPGRAASEPGAGSARRGSAVRARLVGRVAIRGPELARRAALRARSPPCRKRGRGPALAMDFKSKLLTLPQAKLSELAPGSPEVAPGRAL